MTTRRLALAFASLVALTNLAAAAEGGLTLNVGRTKKGSAYFHQPISVKNETTDITAPKVRVECGFFLRDELVGTDYTTVNRIGPGETGYSTMMVKVDDADRAVCRIVGVRE
jgi:hypothetical protein